MSPFFFANIYIKIKSMKIPVKKASIFLLVEEISNSILSHISVDNYFNFTNDKKLALQYFTLKYIKTKLKSDMSIKDDEIKNFLILLRKKNEEAENYEFASILLDIYNNFVTINEFTKTTKIGQKNELKQKKIN